MAYASCNISTEVCNYKLPLTKYVFYTRAGLCAKLKMTAKRIYLDTKKKNEFVIVKRIT